MHPLILMGVVLYVLIALVSLVIIFTMNMERDHWTRPWLAAVWPAIAVLAVVVAFNDYTGDDKKKERWGK